MRTKLSLLVFLFCSFLNAQLLFKLSDDTLKSFSYSGGDEFNSETINQDKWSMRPWPGTNMGQFFSFETSNTKIEDGVAILTVLKKDSLYRLGPEHHDSSFLKKAKLKLVDMKFPMKYSAGILISKQKYHYGLYELKFKIEKGKGIWPAFWFFGGNKNEEIDVFELKGEKTNQIHVDTHCPFGCDKGYKNKLGFNTNWGDWLPVTHFLHEGFNIMQLDWKPGELIWYINGYPLAYFKGDFPNPMNLYLNTQVASQYSAFQPAPDETTIFPNNFYIDFIRVWKQNQNTPTLTIANNMEVSKSFKSNYFNKAARHRGLVYNRKKLDSEEGIITLVLLEANKLNVCALGTINQETTSLSLIGEYGTYAIKTGIENSITLDGREKELELIVKTQEKVYNQKIKISR